MIDTKEKLEHWLPVIRRARWIALDTEADSLHAYPEKLCLLQFSTGEGDKLVDPLAGFGLGSLLESLSGHELILHGADYDLRLLRKHHSFAPTAIFDTMLAARLLGWRQFGLAHLVETVVGVKLDKAPQKANWARRPLTDRMSRYAMNDTRHLKPLADHLRDDLKRRGRLEWHQEWCARLVAECSVKPEPGHAEPWRIKGSAVLGRRALAVLRGLWRWREAEAIAASRPPYFILAHEKLLKIAAGTAAKHSIDSLLPSGLSRRRKHGATAAIQEALSLPEKKLPDVFKHNHRRPSEAERRRFLELEKRRNQHARDLDIDPTVIASRSDLSGLAHDLESCSSSLMKWQLELLVP